MLRRVEAWGGLTTNVTSVCQLLALPFSLSTGSTEGLPSTDATVGWALVSGPKRPAKRTWASSSSTFASRKTRALCLFKASRIWAMVASHRSALRSSPRISAPMREPSLANSSLVSVMADMMGSFAVQYFWFCAFVVQGMVLRVWSAVSGADGGAPAGESAFDRDEQ